MGCLPEHCPNKIELRARLPPLIENGFLMAPRGPLLRDETMSRWCPTKADRVQCARGAEATYRRSGTWSPGMFGDTSCPMCYKEC